MLKNSPVFAVWFHVGWAPQPASTEFLGRSCIIMLGTGGSVCGSAGLWWFAGSERRLQNTHYAGERCGSVQFGSLLGGYMLCEFLPNVVSVRDLSGVGQCWVGSLLPCGGLHVL